MRRAYAAGFVVWSIACALTGAFRHIAAIMFFRIAMGAGQSVAFPASARTVANWFPDTERGLVNSSYLTGVRIGQALRCGRAVVQEAEVHRPAGSLAEFLVN